MSEKKIIGKNKNPVGITPSIALINPKFPHNVGQTIRAASCFDIPQVWYTGDRVSLDSGERLPREERMKGYSKVELIQFDYFFDQFKNATPVAIEITPTSEILSNFEHPENPIYIFGPEDGSIPQVVMRHCHRFVTIPTRHCTNLSAAVYIVLYDRLLKRHQNGVEPVPNVCDVLDEPRGWYDFEEKVNTKKDRRESLNKILK